MRHFLLIAICLSVALSSPCSGFAILNGEIGKYHFARRNKKLHIFYRFKRSLQWCLHYIFQIQTKET